MITKEQFREQLDNFEEITRRLNDMFDNNADKVKYCMALYTGVLRAVDRVITEKRKYKRAFEILKEYSHLPPLEKFVYEEDGNYYVARIEEYDVGSDIPVTYHYLLDKEEYELIEELM